MTDTSDFTLRFENRPDYLYAFVTGPQDSPKVAREFFTQIHARASELGSKAIIVEEDFPNQLSTIDIFEIVEDLSRLFAPEIKIAHVDRQATDMDLNNFGETVAVNRGINGHVFSRIEDAEQWLINSCSPSR